jgi:hypothetical protein
MCGLRELEGMKQQTAFSKGKIIADFRFRKRKTAEKSIGSLLSSSPDYLEHQVIEYPQFDSSRIPWYPCSTLIKREINGN